MKEKPMLGVDYVRNRIEKRTVRLSSILLSDLQNPALNSTEIKKTTAFLVRLNLGDNVLFISLNFA